MGTPLPLQTPLKSRAGALTKDQFMRNAVVERIDQSRSYVSKRPGLLLFSTDTATGTGQGITSYQDNNGNEFFYKAAGGVLYNANASIPGTSWTQELQSNFTMTSGALTRCGIVYWNGYFWAVGSNSAFTRFGVFYSADGVTYTKLVDVADGTAGYPNAAWWRMCVHNGNLILFGGRDGGGTTLDDCWSSTNGSTWTQKTASATGLTTAIVRAVVSHGGALYSFHEGTTTPVWTSTDNGATWTSKGATQAFNVGGSARTEYGVVSFGGYLWVIGGTGTSMGQTVYRSTAGASWTELGTNVLSFAHANSNSHFALVAGGFIHVFELYNNSTIKGRIYTSVGGTTWTLISTTATSGTYPVWNDNNNHIFADLIAYKTSIATFALVSGAGIAITYPWILTQSSVTNASVGTIGNGLVDFAQDYARTILGIKSSTTLYALTVASGAVAQVTDADYPSATVRGLVYLDGYFFVMDANGTIYNSQPEDLTSWVATDYIDAEFEPDGGVALAKFNNYVVAFGNYTTEFFFDAGNATGSPLSPVQNGVMAVGCADGDTVKFMDGEVYFVGQAKGDGQSIAKGRFVAKLAGVGYEKLSSPDVDRILEADDFLDVDATAFKVGGHSYYMVRLGTTGISLVLDLGSMEWHVWTTRRTSFTATPSNIVTASNTATATLTHSFADGDVGVFTGGTSTHTALNGTYNVTVPASGTLCWRLSGTSYSGTNTATMTATGWSTSDMPIVAAAGFSGKQLLQDKSNGNIYELDVDTYRDNSIYMDFLVRTAKLDGDSQKRKFTAYADLVSDRVNGNAMLRMSDDDAASWTMFKSKSLSGGQTRWNRLGSSRRRQYEIRVTDNVAFRGERLEVEVTGGQ